MKKKILSLTAAILLFVMLTTSVFAASDAFTGIRSLKVNNDLTEYAFDIFPKHLHALLKTGALSGDMEEYGIGDPFTVFNVKEDTNSDCFPVLKNGNIVAILEVVDDNGEYNSSMSVSFAEELKDLLTDRTLNDFVLLTDGVNLQAFDGKRTVDVFKLFEDGSEPGVLAEDFDLPFSSLSKTSEIYDLTTDLNLESYKTADASLLSRPVPELIDSRILNVRGVIQEGYTCWAATCAAIINYYNRDYLTAKDVARYVKGDGWNESGYWSEMKRAYNHWGLRPAQTGVIGFGRVKSNINHGDPMHLGLNYRDGAGKDHGHSLGLIGYEVWDDPYYYEYDRVLILLEPNTGRERSVTLNSDGNFRYRLSGGMYEWVYTREF